MKTCDERDDRLIEPLLRAGDRAVESARSGAMHPDEETLALFASGELAGGDRTEVVRHLSECVACRRTVSLVLANPVEVPDEIRRCSKRFAFFRSPRVFGLVAAAAVLLLAVGLIVFRGVGNDPGLAEHQAYLQADALLRSGDFAGARTVVAQAMDRGALSDRIKAIDAEAVRLIPAPLALAFAGRLTDFGFEIGGATARETNSGQSTGKAEEALKVLARSGSTDDTIALNRGHALLSIQQPREALVEFLKVVDRSPGSSLAWLGQGLARYALADYPAAEEAFRTSSRLDPELAAARVNLAMTLGEEGKIDEALAAWRDVLARPGAVSAQERQAIENEVEELRRAREGLSSSTTNSGKKE